MPSQPKINIKNKYGAPKNDQFKNADSWTSKLTYRGRSYTFPFYKGSAFHGAEPTVTETLKCLIEDADNYDCSDSFDDWCEQYGYDTDDPADRRRYLKMYLKCRRVKERLEQLLGNDFEDIREVFLV